MRFPIVIAAMATVCSVVAPVWAQVAPPAATTLTVGTEITRSREELRPFGIGGFGDPGGCSYAANNFVSNPGNEPISIRRFWRVTETDGNSFEGDRGGIAGFDVLRTGFLNGAKVRVYRIVDAQGNSLPPDTKRPNGYWDLSTAHHVIKVREDVIAPKGSPGLPDGGFVADKWTTPKNISLIRDNTTYNDPYFLENGKTCWYTVVAVDASGNESPQGTPVSVTPAAGASSGPAIYIASGANGNGLPPVAAGAGIEPYQFPIKVTGGKAPFTFSVLDADGKPASLPAGLSFDPATGQIKGKVQTAPATQVIQVAVTDATGKRDTRRFTLNRPADIKDPKDKTKPEPPTAITATAGDGFVRLSWTASPSTDVIGYRILRSETAPEKQRERVYLSGNGPKLEKHDYVFAEMLTTTVDTATYSPRVRPLGPDQKLTWYWTPTGGEGVGFSLVPHPAPLPATFADPGDTCLRIDLTQPGQRGIMQPIFCGTKHSTNHWYGQLEPGAQYRLKVWLRQEGLADGGKVGFGYSGGATSYPGIRTSFTVTGDWKPYTFTFTAPERPENASIFGHEFTFTGPGSLWMDNAIVERIGIGGDDKHYVPNPTIMKELLATQPATGTKGALRSYEGAFNHATMLRNVSWYSNSKLIVDWYTQIDDSNRMTLAHSMELAYRTGDSPETRMRPFLTLQVYPNEEEWLGFFEYLAAPYDPAKDSPKSKPYAYERFKQRGHGRPWTDEFTQIMVEYGNESWHNGVFADWQGFGPFAMIAHNHPQYGKEYGLFTQYMFGHVREKSPYWKSQNLDQKIRIQLNGFYDGKVEKDGSVVGYAMLAKQNCPIASDVSLAVYVGAPQWETGLKFDVDQYDDNGIQLAFAAFQASPADGIKLRQSQLAALEVLRKKGMAVGITAYEGGPSGSGLVPGKEKSPEALVSHQKYRFSKALGVSTLDGFLACSQLGWREFCYSGYGQGQHANSHLTMANGFRSKAAWSSLAMRNLHATGDMVKVDAAGAPTLHLKGMDVPLINSYAFRDGNKLAVFVLSFKLDGSRAGTDFGDGSTPVDLKLPCTAVGKITLHTLTGEPRDTNLDEMRVKPVSRQIPASAFDSAAKMLRINAASGGVAGGMPPGNVFVYVLEDCKFPAP